jgi:hypothetical protein
MSPAVASLRSAPVPARTALGILAALLLAVRLLMPAGFMPSFDHGAVTIVACPDWDGGSDGAPMAGHHHHGSAKLKSNCPYAAAAGLSGLTNELPLLPALLTFGLALLLGRTYAFIDRQRTHERPPPRGPPIPV